MYHHPSKFCDTLNQVWPEEWFEVRQFVSLPTSADLPASAIISPMKLAILDDHQMVADSLKNHLLKTIENAEFIYCGGDLEEVCKVSAASKPDLVIADLDLGDSKTPAAVVSKIAETGAKVWYLALRLKVLMCFQL